jgi:FlaG/FlaF family flagellin (archaellin)
MKPLRILLIAFAVLIVAGTIASAATGGVHGKPTPSPSVAVSDSPSPEPTETEAPEPTETEAPEAEATTSDESGTAPNFSACDGLTGLDNAICRHEALLKVKPDNPGLTNSLSHLQANLAAKAEKKAAKAAGTHGNSGSHGPPGS